MKQLFISYNNSIFNAKCPRGQDNSGYRQLSIIAYWFMAGVSIVGTALVLYRLHSEGKDFCADNKFNQKTLVRGWISIEAGWSLIYCIMSCIGHASGDDGTACCDDIIRRTKWLIALGMRMVQFGSFIACVSKNNSTSVQTAVFITAGVNILTGLMRAHQMYEVNSPEASDRRVLSCPSFFNRCKRGAAHTQLLAARSNASVV